MVRIKRNSLTISEIRLCVHQNPTSTKLLCFKFMNEVRAHETEGLITFAWAKHSTNRHGACSPLQLCQSISILTCNTPAAFPILGLSQAETAANVAEWCQTVWGFCDVAKWGLVWNETHLHSSAKWRFEPRWKAGTLARSIEQPLASIYFHQRKDSVFCKMCNT